MNLFFSKMRLNSLFKLYSKLFRKYNLKTKSKMIKYIFD